MRDSSVERNATKYILKTKSADKQEQKLCVFACVTFFVTAPNTVCWHHLAALLLDVLIVVLVEAVVVVVGYDIAAATAVW